MPPPGTIMWTIGRDRQHRLGGRPEQQIVDHRLVLIGDIADRCRQGEHDVEVRHRQKLRCPRRHPFARRRALALRTMPVAAAVVGDRRVTAGVVLATQDVPAERRGAAALDRAHHLELAEAYVTTVGLTPSGPVAAEDIRDLESWPGHRGRLCRRCLHPLRYQRGEAIQRAHDLADDVGGDLGVARCGVELGMPERTRVTLITFLRH
jgi:hypothetical protein